MGHKLTLLVTALVCTIAGILVSPRIPDLGGKLFAKTGEDHAASPDTESGKGHGRNSRSAVTPVTVAEARTMPFPQIIKTFATVQAPDMVTVAARISSQLMDIHVKDGQIVKKGDLLFTLDDRALKAQLARDEALLAKDQAQLVSLAAEAERSKNLLGNSVTRQAYDAAVAAEQSAQAAVNADQSIVDADRIQLDYTRITAPIGGRLGAVQASVGDLVNGGGSTIQTLVTITTIDPVDVAFRLPESELHVFKTMLDDGQAVQVVARRGGTDEKIGEGTLDFIDSSVDTASGTIAMRATFANADQALWPGEYVDIDVNQGTLPDATVIPAVAVQPGQDGAFVYLVKEDDTVNLRPIRVAASDDKRAAIGEGLAPGDRVVTEGQGRLRPGDKVAIATAEEKTADAQ